MAAAIGDAPQVDEGTHVIGLVLAAGQGQRLRPDTDALPKTLLPVDGELTILDVILRNLAKVGITDAVLVAGHAAEALIARVPDLEARHGLAIEIIRNDRFDRNNAYSLWLARDAYAGGALLVNGDTVHPVDVEQTLLSAATNTASTELIDATPTGASRPPAPMPAPRPSPSPLSSAPEIILALDVTKQLTGEAMKVTLTDNAAGIGHRTVHKITKQMPAADAHGEYIGATLIGAGVAGELTAALDETWRRDPNLYYEDGYQVLADQGVPVGVAPLPSLEWVEVDDHADLARAREVACRC
jgi:choline kinase